MLHAKGRAGSVFIEPPSSFLVFLLLCFVHSSPFVLKIHPALHTGHRAAGARRVGIFVTKSLAQTFCDKTNNNTILYRNQTRRRSRSRCLGVAYLLFGSIRTAAAISLG